MLMTILWLIAGLVFLVLGAELLVKGAANLARAAGVSSLVVGLTVVAYGTSTPELLVSVQGALNGQADIATGNVVGSNIFNVLFILGVSALITPLSVSSQLIRVDVPIMIACSLLTIMVCFDGLITRWEGLLLLGLIVVYSLFVVRSALKEKKENLNDGSKAVIKQNLFLQIVWIILGLTALVLGSQWMIESSVKIARALNVSELVIGLTLVAAGTSLPEVATSIMASIRGERDIAVGNVVGSNIFNILCVLGSAATISKSGIAVAPSLIHFDIPIMLIVALACLPIFFSGRIIARWEGGVFLFYYVAYTLYLILQSVQHDALPTFSHTMLLFVVPITIVTLLVLSHRQYIKSSRIT